MNYQFRYQTTAFDFFQLAMYYTYGSLVGICNIVFTVAMLLVTVKFWDQGNNLVKGLMLIGCCLFPIIQPLAIYRRAKRQVATVPPDIQIGFDDKGIHVQTQNNNSHVKWQSIKRIAKKPHMIIIFSNQTHGFMLTNKVLGQHKEDFYHYLTGKVTNKK